jgi:capsid protein
MISKLISWLPQRTRSNIVNALGAGLALPSGNPSQGRAMPAVSQTRDITPIQRREAVAAHRILRDRVPFVRALINAIVDLALGDQGMIPVFRSGDPEYDQRALAYYKRATRRQTFDVTGQETGASMQRLVLRSVITDGEIFGIKVIDGFGKSQRQLICTEQVGNFAVGNTNIIDGIEYNTVMRPVRYHVVQLKPGNFNTLTYGTTTEPIDARDVLHVYDRERATMKRGLPWGYTGINHGIDTIDIAELLKTNVKLGAAVIGSVTTPTGDLPKTAQDLVAAATRAAAAGTAAATRPTQKDTEPATRFLDIHGTMIPVFKAGEGMNFYNGRAAANEIEFLGWLAAQYAIGLGLPIENVVGIGTGSAATHANSDIVQRFLKCVQRIITDDWNQPSTENILSTGILAYSYPGSYPGVEPLQPPKDVARYADIQWRGPRGFQVNKTRDAKSNIDLIARGLKTVEEYWSENGEDPDEAEQHILQGRVRRRAAWLAQGLDEARFWQVELGTNAQQMQSIPTEPGALN